MERKYIIGLVLGVVIIIGFIIGAVKERFGYHSIRPNFTDSSYVPKPQPALDYVQTSDQTLAEIADQKKVNCTMRRLFYNGKC